MANPNQPRSNGADEMHVTDAVAEPPATASFATKLKAQLEGLPVGKVLEVRTREDRQAVTNAVTQTKKKTGINFTTKLMEKRGEDGKMKIHIENKGPIPAPAQPAAD